MYSKSSNLSKKANDIFLTIKLCFILFINWNFIRLIPEGLSVAFNTHFPKIQLNIFASLEICGSPLDLKIKLCGFK